MMRQATTAAAAIAFARAMALAASAQPQTPPAAAAPAPAAPAPGGLFTSGGPVDVGADKLQQFQSESRLLYTGNVDVVQGTARLRAPLMNVFTAKKPPGAAAQPAQAGDMGSIERIEIDGPLYYVTPTQQVKGDHGTYIAADDTITVVGNVTLLQGQDVLHGDKLVIEQKTGHSTLTTNTPGKGPQRVRGVFFPKDKPAPGSPAAPAPGASAAPPRT